MENYKLADEAIARLVQLLQVGILLTYRPRQRSKIDFNFYGKSLGKSNNYSFDGA